MKNILYPLILLIIIITSCSKPGIAPDQANSFVKYYGSSRFSEGFDVKELPDGSILALGYEYTDSMRLYLIKTDQYGNRIWAKTYGTVTNTHGFSFQVMTDGSLILMGNSPDSSSNIYLVKTDISGNILWTRHLYNSNIGIWGNCIQLTSNGGFVITGAYNNSGNKNAYIQTLDGNGIINNVRTNIYDNKVFSSEAKTVIEFKNSFFIISGFSNYNTGTGIPAFWIVKNNSPNQCPFDGLSVSDYGSSFKMLPDSSFIFAGTTSLGSTTNLILVKFKVFNDAIDTIFIKKNIDTIGNNKNFCIELGTDGKYAIIGTHVNNDNSQSMFFLQVDNSGKPITQMVYGKTGNQRGNSLCKSINGGFITVGAIEYTSNLSSIFTLMKLKSDGGF